MLATAPDPSRGKGWGSSGLPSTRVVTQLACLCLFSSASTNPEVVSYRAPLPHCLCRPPMSHPSVASLGFKSTPQRARKQLPVQRLPGCYTACCLTCLQACTSYMLSTGMMPAGSAGISHTEYPPTHVPVDCICVSLSQQAMCLRTEEG